MKRLMWFLSSVDLFLCWEERLYLSWKNSVERHKWGVQPIISISTFARLFNTNFMDKISIKNYHIFRSIERLNFQTTTTCFIIQGPHILIHSVCVYWCWSHFQRHIALCQNVLLGVIENTLMWLECRSVQLCCLGVSIVTIVFSSV